MTGKKLRGIIPDRDTKYSKQFMDKDQIKYSESQSHIAYSRIHGFVVGVRLDIEGSNHQKTATVNCSSEIQEIGLSVKANDVGWCNLIHEQILPFQILCLHGVFSSSSRAQHFNGSQLQQISVLSSIMQNTSLSLLDRVRQTDGSDLWSELVELYSPMLSVWLRKFDVPVTDIDDLKQEVMTAVVTDLRNFEHNGRTGAFRSWLKTILIHRLRNYWRTRKRHLFGDGASDFEQRIAQLNDPNSELSRVWDIQHDEFVLRQLLQLAEPHFEATTWTAFRRVTLDGDSPAEVSADLGISTNAIFIAKSRVLSHLRHLADGLIASSSVF